MLRTRSHVFETGGRAIQNDAACGVLVVAALAVASLRKGGAQEEETHTHGAVVASVPYGPFSGKELVAFTG